MENHSDEIDTIKYSMINSYNAGDLGEEIFYLLIHDGDGRSEISISRIYKKSFMVSIYGQKRYESGINGYYLSEEEYNNFVKYLVDNNVDSYKNFRNGKIDSEAEYLYMHCSEDGISSFRFIEPSTEKSEKYADLIRAFVSLIENFKPEVES